MVRLARVSGRDGRILWDIAPSNYVTDVENVYPAANGFLDFDGDGSLDVALVPGSIQPAGKYQGRLVVISLRDGKLIWSRPIHYAGDSPAQFQAGKLGGGGRPAVIVMAKFDEGESMTPGVRAFDRGDGPPCWSNKPTALPESGSSEGNFHLANLDGRGKRSVCVAFKGTGGQPRLIVFDGNGGVRTRRDLSDSFSSILDAADLNGDGRDELLVSFDGRLHALDGDLKEVWSWPTQSMAIDAIIPGSAGRACEVMISPGLGLDGATGRPLWTGQASLLTGPGQFTPELLDPGNSRRLPLLIGNGLGATVCRVAMRTTPEGAISEARGAIVQPGLAVDDPRWARPLPWVKKLTGALGPWGQLAASGLAMVCVVLPLLIVRLARGRRRFYTIRALMGLPVAAALPLMVYLTLVPRLPVSSSPLLASEARVFIIGTLAGLPIVVCVGWTCACVGAVAVQAGFRAGGARVGDDGVCGGGVDLAR